MDDGRQDRGQSARTNDEDEGHMLAGWGLLLYIGTGPMNERRKQVLSLLGDLLQPFVTGKLE